MIKIKNFTIELRYDSFVLVLQMIYILSETETENI